MTGATIHARSRARHLARAGTWPGVIRAELIRLKSSALQWFPLIGLLIGLLSSTFSLWSSGAHDASGILSWQAMYITGMAAPTLALLAGLAETREKKARYGGTNLRPVSPIKTRAARLMVLIALSAVFHLLNFGVAWLYAVADHRAGAGTILSAGVLSWIGSISTIALFSIVARVTGMIPALLVAVVYQVAGTLTAEASWWWAFPPAWPVRLLLPTLGIHSNAVPLEPGHPLAEESPVAGLALNLAFAVVTVGLAVALRGQRVAGKRPSPHSRDSDDGDDPKHATVDPSVTGLSHHPVAHIRGEHNVRENQSLLNVLAAVHRPLSRTAVTPLSITAVVLVYAVALIYPPGYVSGLYTFAILPLGAGLLPVMTWSALSGAWTIAVTENHRIRGAYLAWQAILLLLLAVGTGGAHLLAGGDLTQTARMVVLWALTGILLTMVSTALRIRFGSGVAIAATVLWTVVSATLGGDVLAETVLWLVAVPSWPETADTAARFVIAIVLQALLISGSTVWATREIRDSERRG